MATINRAVATLRITGDSLDPDEVTRRLGAAPSLAYRSGEELRGPKSGHVRIAKFGRWNLPAVETEPADLDAQVLELLRRLTPDLATWRDLSSRYSIDLFCGWFMACGNEGISILPATLTALGERGIELTLDIYEGDGDAADH